jgi:hypothetical protein
VSGEAPTILPSAVDHHVHLGLVDRDALAGGSLTEVIDCGWDPAESLVWRADPPAGVRVLAAGPFHTAVGGYPRGRSWAPNAAVRQIADREAVLAAVVTAAQARYDAFKIALHDGMPMLSDELLGALTDGAHQAALSVFVHAEGSGQAMRAVRAGADVLVHSPWTEELTEVDIRECVAREVTWVSTLAIHEREDRSRALSNVRRFHAAGGVVLYGTDMGNGDTPVGVSAAELHALEEAGITGAALRDTILVGDAALQAPLPLPDTAAELIAWLAGARRAEAHPHG